MTAATAPRTIGFGPKDISTSVNEFVVEQHADDAAFLWAVRDRGVRAPNFRLRELARWDERVEAHLDGLRIAGDAGWKFCERALGDPTPGAVFAAAVLALGGTIEPRVERVVEAGCAEPPLERGLVSAAGWLRFPHLEQRLAAWLRAPEPALRRVAIAAHAVHRHDPGRQLTEALADAHPRVRARALAAAGELGRADLLPQLRTALADEDAACRFHAAWSATLLGDRSAPYPRLRERARGTDAWARPSLDLALRILPLDRARTWQRELRDDPGGRRAAVIAAGVIGDPEFVGELIELAADDVLARAAGEAISMITGADLDFLDLDRDAPEGFEPPPPGCPEDAGVEADPDATLPWPDAAALRKWWKRERGAFEPGARWLLGRPLDDDAARHALATGFQRQRAAGALEFALANPGGRLFEVRARAHRQAREVGSWNS